MFSKACEYGIRAIIYISQKSQDGHRVNLKSVAKAIDSPEAFTAKVLQSLANNNIISSSKGSSGGYDIPENRQSNITLFDVVNAIDGDTIYDKCGLGLQQCNPQKPCPMHYKFIAIRDNLKQMSQQTTIHDLTKELLQGTTCLKR
ncbi:MAG: Rrf2 family transcriptional regulator [Saprospiraceae bacterium]